MTLLFLTPLVSKLTNYVISTDRSNLWWNPHFGHLTKMTYFLDFAESSKNDSFQYGVKRCQNNHWFVDLRILYDFFFQFCKISKQKMESKIEVNCNPFLRGIVSTFVNFTVPERLMLFHSKKSISQQKLMLWRLLRRTPGPEEI